MRIIREWTGGFILLVSGDQRQYKKESETLGPTFGITEPKLPRLTKKENDYKNFRKADEPTKEELESFGSSTLITKNEFDKFPKIWKSCIKEN